MNKEGVYRVVEQALKQYYEETGILITQINVANYTNTSTENKRQCLISLETTEKQLYAR